jgi:hypothetical protein
MRSSTSSSERLTAADRPGVAQPVPVRDVPAQPWGGIALAAAALAIAALGAWEWTWRSYGVEPAYRNSDGQWAIERRRIDEGEGDSTVLIGASRVLFDVQLDVWERVAGERPIQLALEGTSPLSVLEDLADDPDFTGRLLVGVAPDIYFTGFAYRGKAFAHYRDEGPSERVGQWLSMRLVEPWFAFYDDDFALAVVLRRQAWWPARPDLPPHIRVRKLSVSGIDRNTHLWSKVAQDPAYRALTRQIWRQGFSDPAPEAAVVDEQIRRSVAAVGKLRARGVPVVFVRPPSDGEYLAFEDRVFPRATTWDVLLGRTGAPGIHFADFPQLVGMELPEWSHLAQPDAERFTAELHALLETENWGQAAVAARHDRR